MTDGIWPTGVASGAENGETPQVEHRLLRLTAQVEVLEHTLNALLDLAQAGQDQLSVLVSSAVDPRREQGLNTQLAEVTATLQAQQEATERLDARAGQLASDADMQALLASAVRQEQLAALEDRMAKLVRTQFKTNTLNESQLQQLANAQSALHELAERRQTRQDEQLLQEATRLDEARTLGRQELAADLLPAIDGLELALENGRSWAARQTQMLADTAAPRTHRNESPANRWQRLRLAWDESPPSTPSTPGAVEERLLQEGIQETNAWLAGLELVRARFAGLLAADGITPIDPLGAPFDPHQHVAIDTVENPEMAPNTVAEVARKGYRQGNRVIRYAEVVVVRAPASSIQDTGRMHDNVTE